MKRKDAFIFCLQVIGALAGVLLFESRSGAG
ncbi:MAG: hypothetical protein KatS3mg105_2803 [Gemmatales bacterium]|nr:MAG: hypothetical protein KatS3mg105_2803 [Gemmatales bacterium]